MFRFLILVLGLAAGAAFFLKPGEERAEELLGARIIAAINAQDVALEKGAAGNALLIGCKLRPSDCMAVLGTQISTVYSDYTLLSTYAAEGLGLKVWCIGAYGRLFCPAGFRES